jgi:hypothetical protein
MSIDLILINRLRHIQFPPKNLTIRQVFVFLLPGVQGRDDPRGGNRLRSGKRAINTEARFYIVSWLL